MNSLIISTVDASHDSCFNVDRFNTHWFLLESRDCRWLVPRSGHCQETILKKQVHPTYPKKKLAKYLTKRVHPRSTSHIGTSDVCRSNQYQNRTSTTISNCNLELSQPNLVGCSFAIRICSFLQLQFALFFCNYNLLLFAITQLMAGDYS